MNNFFDKEFLSDCIIEDSLKNSFKCHAVVLVSKSDLFKSFFELFQKKQNYKILANIFYKMEDSHNEASFAGEQKQIFTAVMKYFYENDINFII